jgi:outer membrane biosynthesis protein TonB
LDQVALEAVRQWRYEPAMLNGQAVPVKAVVSLNFAVR